MRSAPVLFLFALAVHPCVAAESANPDSLKIMEEVIVTANPIIEGSAVTRYGENVSTVCSRQVDDLNAQDFPTALRRVPGITISRYNLIGSYGGADGGAVYIRGLGSGRPGAEISMLVDGIPRFVGVWTHPLMDIMSIDYADRIDIHKSAQPVLLGNMSYASVNVQPIRMTHEGFDSRFESAGGSYGTMVERLEHGGKVGGFDYYLTGSQRQSNGNRDNADGKVHDLYGRMGYKFNDKLDATFQVTHSDGQVDDPGIENAPPKPIVERFDTDNELYIGTLSFKQGIADGSAKIYYENGKIDWRQWDGTVEEQFTTITNYENYGLRVRETFTLPGDTEVVTGIDHDVYGGMTKEKRPSGDKNYKNILFSNTAPYAMVSRKFGNTTSIVPSIGVRYNVSRYFGNQVGAQAGVTMSHNETQVYANAARAYNLPGVYAAVQYDTSWSFNGANNGKWKDLNPELLDHYEIGLSRTFTEKLHGGLNFYYENVTDALRFVSPPPPPPHYANTGAYQVRGAETTLSYDPIRNLDLFGGVSLMSTTPKDVPNAPETSMSAGANYTARYAERARR